MQVETAITDIAAAARAGGGLVGLVNFEGTAEEFWPRLLEALGGALSARRVLLLSSTVGKPWQARAQWPARVSGDERDAELALRLLTQAQPGLPFAAFDERDELVLALLPNQQREPQSQVLALVVLGVDARIWDEISLCAWAGLVAAIPGQFVLRQQAAQADAAQPGSRDETKDLPESSRQLYEILRLSVRLGNETGFMPLAMALCNELSQRYGCGRVSLGWVGRGTVRLVNASHIEKFDEKSSATRALEAAMEEALEQDALLTYPPVDGTSWVLRAHQAYAERIGAHHLCTLPLQRGEQVDAVLCLERDAAALNARELWELRLIGEAIARWLFALHERERWFGVRLYEALRRQAAEFFRPRHTAAKLAGVGGVALLIGLLLTPWAYRVDATLVVRSQDLLFVPAPFDGYLRAVRVDIGKEVRAGDLLVALDTTDLEQEASMAEADLVRYTREVEKALATQQLGDMQIAAARQQQSAARLGLIRYKLAHAEVKAPHAGVVIEGELRKNLGAPLRKGDLLLKLAKTSDTYLELEIDQSEVQEVAPGSRAEFALVGRPDQRRAITLTRIDPAAVTRDGHTLFLARAQLEDESAGDWRPGMGGSAKIDAGRRPLIWVITHRTVRFLREYFWI